DSAGRGGCGRRSGEQQEDRIRADISRIATGWWADELSRAVREGDAEGTLLLFVMGGEGRRWQTDYVSAGKGTSESSALAPRRGGGPFGEALVCRAIDDG